MTAHRSENGRPHHRQNDLLLHWQQHLAVQSHPIVAMECFRKGRRNMVMGEMKIPPFGGGMLVKRVWQLRVVNCD
jgi:hypothetical protein